MVRRSNRRRAVAACLCVILMLAAGCAQKQIFDETGLTTVVGYDYLQNGRVRGTVVMPVINPDAQDKIQVLSVVSDSSKGIRDQANLQSDRRVMAGQLRVVLFNRDQARQGIISIVDTYSRDPSIGSRVYFCVVDGNAYDLLTYKFKEEGNIGIYLYRMIEQNVQGEKLPSATLHEFLRSYYSDGSDPYLPLIAKKGDEVIIKGIALFHKDRLISWIPPKEAFFVKLLRDQFHMGSYETSIPHEQLGLPKPKDEGVQRKGVLLVFDPLRSQVSVKVVRRKNPVKFDVKIKLNTRILEVSAPLELGDKAIVRKLEHALQEKVEKQLRGLIAKLQKWEVDPAGFGDMYRAQVRGARKLKHEEWRRMYRQAAFSVHVDAQIIRTGITD